MTGDLTFKGKNYRFKEYPGGLIASIHRVEKPFGCFSCPAILMEGALYFMPFARCIPCAIRSKVLIPIPPLSAQAPSTPTTCAGARSENHGLSDGHSADRSARTETYMEASACTESATSRRTVIAEQSHHFTRGRTGRSRDRGNPCGPATSPDALSCGAVAPSAETPAR